MYDWIQLAIAAISGGAITTALQKINLLKPDKRKGNAEAEKQELENDDIRFNGLIATVDDLNKRLVDALGRMRELEEALNKSNAKILELKDEVEIERSKVKILQIENEDMKKRINILQEENEELKSKIL